MSAECATLSTALPDAKEAGTVTVKFWFGMFSVALSNVGAYAPVKSTSPTVPGKVDEEVWIPIPTPMFATLDCEFYYDQLLALEREQ